MLGAQQPATVLLVDPDRITFLVIRQAFTLAPWIRLEHVESGEDAITFMARHRVNLIVSETELPDSSGMALHRRLTTRGTAPPYIFLSADNRKETHYKALREGAADFILKPCDPVEMRLRCLAVLEREHRDREQRDRAAEPQQSILEGTLEALSLPDLFSVFAMARASGMLSVYVDANTATVFLDKGEPTAAKIGNKTGLDALYHLLALPPAGRFSLSKPEVVVPRNVHAGMMEVLMEAARLQDERALGAKSPMVRRMSSSGVGDHARGDKVFAPLPTPALARRLTDQIADPFTFGELHLMTADALGQWSRRKHDGVRVDVWLVCDVAVGARAMLEIASPVSELLLVTSMGGGSKVMAMVFALRDDLELNILLLDPRSAVVFAAELARSPALAIVAQVTPPGGATASSDVSTGAYLGVSQLFAAHALDLLMVSKDLVGAVDWDTRMPARARSPRIVAVDVGPELDLRAQVLEGIATWGTLLNEVRSS
jgi:CheY-like chemotaxis protein